MVKIAAFKPGGILSLPVEERSRYECQEIWYGQGLVPTKHDEHRCRKLGEHVEHRCSGCNHAWKRLTDTP